MLMFMRPEDADQVRQKIRDYAFQQDSNELTTDKARKARFHAEAIDPDKGSATGYVAKYISKNIDGYALDGELDDESGKELKETAPLFLPGRHAGISDSFSLSAVRRSRFTASCAAWMTPKPPTASA